MNNVMAITLSDYNNCQFNKKIHTSCQRKRLRLKRHNITETKTLRPYNCRPNIHLEPITIFIMLHLPNRQGT